MKTRIDARVYARVFFCIVTLLAAFISMKQAFLPSESFVSAYFMFFVYFIPALAVILAVWYFFFGRNKKIEPL